MQTTSEFESKESGLGYGGWLRCFRVFNGINWGVGVLVVLALSFVAIMLIYYLYMRGYVSEKPAPILFGIIYYVVCSSYFNRFIIEFGDRLDGHL